MKKRALLSVDDSTHIVTFGKRLRNMEWEIIAISETVAMLREHDIDAMLVDTYVDINE